MRLIYEYKAPMKVWKRLLMVLIGGALLIYPLINSVKFMLVVVVVVTTLILLMDEDL